MFILAVSAQADGARVLNTGGRVTHMGDVVSAIEQATPEMAGMITFEPRALPFPEEFDGESLAGLVGPLPMTPLMDAVRDTIQLFRKAMADGRLSQSRVDQVISS